MLLAVLLCPTLWFAGGRAHALDPDSPEVQKLVQAGLQFLENTHDHRLGGKCLAALVFVKADLSSHQLVQDAVEECRKTIQSNPSPAALDVYSNGLAIILLCELSSKRYAREIDWFLDRMQARQMDHGGWGYHDHVTGDTSQTQYATLSYWEARRRGFRLDPNSVELVAEWLMRTQDPDGCWGYQGNYSTTGELLPQTETNCSMLAAGMGSAYICAHLMRANELPSGDGSEAVVTLPAALRRVDDQPQSAEQRICPQRIHLPDLLAAIHRAHDWMKKNYEVDIGAKSYYYLYALERYKSFQYAFEGAWDDDPQWYRDGYEFLAAKQRADGSWSGFCGAVPDTAFSLLFLLRSTRKSLRDGLGEGTLLAGRGLPTNLGRAKLVQGQIVVEQVRTQVDELLSMIDDDQEGLLDDLARDPRQLVVDEVDADAARRLQQLVRGGEPEVRLLAVKALGRSGNLDYAPTLLYALTDPDRRVVLEARNALRFVSRRFDGFGPPDNYTDAQRYEAVTLWKNWYHSLRPHVVLE